MCSCVNVISHQEIKAARKQHDCMACDFVRENISEINTGVLSIAELRQVAKAKQENYKILKGQPYIRQRNIQDGQIYTFKARPEMHKLCMKYELYPEC